MKRLLLLLFCLSLILGVIGCGGGGGSQGRDLKFYKEGTEASGMASEIKIQSTGDGVALESAYGTYYAPWIGSTNYAPLVATYEVDGVNQNVIVNIAEVENDGLFTYEYTAEPAGFSRAYFTPLKTGKGKMVATYQALAKEIDILVYTACQYTTWKCLAIHGNGADSYAFSNDDPGEASTFIRDHVLDSHPKIVKRCYLAGYAHGVYWDIGFTSIKEVDVSRLQFDNAAALTYTNSYSAQNPIYICEADGGYIKITRVGNNIVWEWTDTTSFM